MYAVEAHDLEVKYEKLIALENVSFRIPHPSITVVLGPNGAGKTTLLRAMLGLVKISKGEIKVFGKNVTENINGIRKLVGYVPQRDYINDYVPLTAFDVVLNAYLLRKGWLSIPRKKYINEVAFYLSLVGLPKDAWKKPFQELSIGQQQKVMIARALVLKPKLLLLDEPFSAVDIPSQCEIVNFLGFLKEKYKISIILVTHDITHIAPIIDYVILLNKKLIAFGRPRDVFTEENLLKTYGHRIRVISVKGFCIPLIGDRHA